jgi:hypothetical protein
MVQLIRRTTVANLKSQLDKVRKHFQKTGGGGDDRWFNVKAPSRGEETKVQIRVLPPWSKRAEGFFYYTVGQHFGFSIAGRNRALDCPESVGNGKCPVCMFISRLKNSGDGDHDKLQQRMRANRRYFVNVIDRTEPDKIKIYGTNKKFIEAVLDASDDEDIGDITDPKNGRDVVIVRRGAGLQTRYSYRIRAKSTPVTFDTKDLHQLDKDVSNWMEYEDMVKVIQENYGEELTEVGLKFGKVKPSKKKKKLVEDEDESISEDDDDEEINTENEEENETEIEEDEDEEDEEEVDYDEDDEDEED